MSELTIQAGRTEAIPNLGTDLETNKQMDRSRRPEWNLPLHFLWDTAFFFTLGGGGGCA